MADHPEKCLEHPVPLKMPETMLRLAKAAAAHDDMTLGGYIRHLITLDLESKRARKKALEEIFAESPQAE